MFVKNDLEAFNRNESLQKSSLFIVAESYGGNYWLMEKYMVLARLFLSEATIARLFLSKATMLWLAIKGTTYLIYLL